MQGQRVVDAAAVCQELDALCVNLELRHQGLVHPADMADRIHAMCLWQLLGSEPEKIVAASGRYVTTTYLRELSHELPWSIEIQFGEHLVTPAWETPEPEQVAMLRRWMERMQTAERPVQSGRDTDDNPTDYLRTIAGDIVLKNELTEEDRPSSEWAKICDFSDDTFRNRMMREKPGKTWRIVESGSQRYRVHVEDLPPSMRVSKKQRDQFLASQKG